MDLTPSHFEEQGIPAIYATKAQGTSVELALTEIRPIAGSRRDGGGFVLTFRGPRDRFLPQATYRLTGRGLEADIFIVPVSADEASCFYEAVFN